MGAEKDIIVAVELASTAIRAIAGRKEPDGRMQVLAFVQEESTNTIRKGVIDNIDRTTQALSRVVGSLGEKLNVKVNRIYIGLGGQSLRTAHNRVLLQFDGKELISHKTIDKMCDTNRGVVYPNAEIKEVVPQEYSMGSRNVVDPVGTQTDSLEANFMNIIARNSLEENIRKCVENAGLEVEEVLLSPLCMANALLTFNERRSGCALVDMGAETTTVSVYTNNILRHLCVIPLGGYNVTSDITSLKVEAEEAEELKRKYGTAYRLDKEENFDNKISLSFNRQESENKLQEIVEARYEEILVNVWHHIAAYKDNLLSGVVMTGGASRIPELTRAFARHTGSDLNVRTASKLPENVTISPSVTMGESDRLYTLYALLLAGSKNCVGEVKEQPLQSELNFDNESVSSAEQELGQEQEADISQEPEDEKEKKTGRSLLERFWAFTEKLLADPDDDVTDKK